MQFLSQFCKLVRDVVSEKYIDVFMGPVCPYVLAPVARFSGKWNIPVLTTGGQASTFRQKELYPLLTTIGGNYEQFSVFIVKLLQRYNWYVSVFSTFWHAACVQLQGTKSELFAYNLEKNDSCLFTFLKNRQMIVDILN